MSDQTTSGGPAPISGFGGEPPSVPASVPPESGGNGVLGGAFWNIVGQAAPIVITIFLTPFVLHGLGVTRYGLFVLTATIVYFLSTFDGGTRATAQRYFALYAGNDDEGSTTRLLVTLLCLIAGFGVVLSFLSWYLAAPLVSAFGVATRYRPESVFLFRTLGVLVAFTFFHNLFVAILQSRSRFAYIVKAGFAVYAIWALGLVATVHFGWGLRGIALVYIAQQVFLTAVIMPAALRYTSRSEVHFLSRPELVEFVKFGGRVQISGLAALINIEFDTLIIGAAVSAKAVAYYNAGANFAENIGGFGAVALAPVQTALGNTMGNKGPEATHRRFLQLHTIWVQAITGLFAAAGGAAYFAIVTWLGSDFRTGAIIAIVALLTQYFTLVTGVTRTYCTIVGQPGVESRYGLFSLLVNVVFTVPLLLLGAVGVASATAVGQLVGALYLTRRARSSLGVEGPGTLAAVPWIPAALTVALVVLLEALGRPVVPDGGVGLILCGVPAAVGLCMYAVLLLGPRRTVELGPAALRAFRRGGKAGLTDFALRASPPPD